MDLRIALHNVQSGIGTTKGYYQYLSHIFRYFLPHDSSQIEKLGNYVHQQDIDILATAEIDKGSKRTRGVDQVELLQQTAGFDHAHFFPAFRYKTRAHQGNALHSRFPIIKTKNHLLPGSGEPRYLGEAKVYLGDRDLTLFVTHLSLNLLHRQEQIQKISERVNASSGPVVLAGDFNIAHEGELDLLEESRLQKVYTAKTFPVWNPTKRLDYIFASKEVQIREGFVCSEAFSDHCLLMANVRV